jgi:hypothetical protein
VRHWSRLQAKQQSKSSLALRETQLTQSPSNMVDVSHPGTSELSQHFAHTRSKPSRDESTQHAQEEDADDEEAAWLREVQESNTGEVLNVESLQAGGLVFDTSQLREEPPSTAKRSLKANLAA